MSRWIESYENHQFHSTWKIFKGQVVNMELPSTADEVLVVEFARLHKALAFIDSLLETIDPELIPLSILTSLNQYTSNCNNHFTNFASNNALAHLQNTNTEIDNLLNILRPITSFSKNGKTAYMSAAKAYIDTIEQALKDINLPIVKEASEKILQLKKHLLDGTESEKSIDTQIEELLQKSQAKYNEINTFYNKTLVDEASQESTKTAVEEAKKDILRDTEDANKKLVDVSNKIDELKKFYIKIFGEENDQGEIAGGLKQELETRLDALKKYEKDQQDNNKNLYAQIESLLPGATSAGLAKAYQVMRESFQEPIKKWNMVFIGSLGVMFLTTLATFFHMTVAPDGTTTYGFLSITNFNETLNSLLFKLPLYGPLIWLAVYASKRRSENQRLEQEYAHKEALAKSYDSYRTQIEKLNQKDQELLKMLLESAIQTISHNASNTLDKKHGDGTPAQDVIKHFTEALEKIVPKIGS